VLPEAELAVLEPSSREEEREEDKAHEGKECCGGEEEPLIEGAECRICQEEDSVANLEVPCACSGSLKVISFFILKTLLPWERGWRECSRWRFAKNSELTYGSMNWETIR